MQDQSTVVITGASSGIGLAVAELVAARGAHVVLVGRTEQRLAPAVDRVREAGHGRTPGRFLADFERLADVRALADQLRDRYPTIDVLINNAGGRIRSYRRTVDGNEATVQVNHLAHFLLSGLLRDRLRGGRIINTAVRPAPNVRIAPEDLNGAPERYRGVPAYQMTKAANILFAMEAARRWPDILSVSFHPGLVRTNIGDGTALRYFFRYAPFLISPERSAADMAPLITAPADELRNGGFYAGGKLPRLNRRIFNPDIAARLWSTSEALVAKG
ncbi:SDR family NAD(P)-dependent oxidoreductase [Catenuloplanes atrovinosus]|uniref:Daunorubicin C-13 ketoreductase n=1 Tax=Catenuloplanes atrovinosus TaxID=137266 RepID=A0AAE4C9Y3_9ACTN|nr:SDR family NAD(P)-dependent oxidoreductase [Catenuloplanes atrovinosus]MDR7276312.1 daunorubicin C-13 ketoreductase [Catenuloplanes atrovinosus]